MASSIIADDGSDTARPLNANGTTKSEITLNGSTVTGGNARLLASDAGEYVVVTADANTVSRRVLIQGLDYTGTNRNSYINTTPGGVAVSYTHLTLPTKRIV